MVNHFERTDIMRTMRIKLKIHKMTTNFHLVKIGVCVKVEVEAVGLQMKQVGEITLLFHNLTLMRMKMVMEQD